MQKSEKQQTVKIKKEKENHYGNHRENETGWQKKVFVTGAAKGIGKCTATAFAEAGADVAIVDLDFEEAQKTAKELAEKTGRKIIAIKTDCTDKEQVDAI
ncbi:SDR family NAD(P)-dependent oxidoreductase [Blautia sp. HCP3S3_D9]|uniref:SDR family NAD(P)-dependent oxidoreductase n=1 Tax=Blautia sp. HCP3S3_D9 TaxID=3438912 RepID=UPI003F8B97CD